MNKQRSFRALTMLVAALSLMALGSLPAYAADQTDLAVALKTLPLLTNKITGSAVMAIVYDPANENSKTDAEAVKAAIDAGIEAPGGVKITSLMVPLADVGSKLSQAKLAFIARGGCSDSVSTAAAAAGVLTITTDLDCVKANKCILGVVSKPSVEIYYSKAASDAAKIGFSQAFSMLVKQV